MTTAERLHDSVLRHRIAWTDLAARVVENEGIPKQEADAQVAALIERRACSISCRGSSDRHHHRWPPLNTR